MAQKESDARNLKMYQYNKTAMNLVPKVILTTLIVLMITSGLVIAPSYALTLSKTTKATFTLPPVAAKCPNGSLAPDNNVSKCPPLVPSTKSDNQSPQNANYKAQATYVQNGGRSFAGVVAQQASQAHNTQNSQQATNAHQASQAQQAHEPQPSKTGSTTTTLKMPSNTQYTAPTLKLMPKNPAPKLP